MALADPQTITINAVAQTLNLISSEGLRSIYATSDEGYKFIVSHQEAKGGRTRRMIRIEKRVIAADPLTAVNEYKTLSSYVVIDEPEYGFSDDDIYDVLAGFLAWLTEANVLKVLGGQH